MKPDTIRFFEDGGVRDGGKELQHVPSHMIKVIITHFMRIGGLPAAARDATPVAEDQPSWSGIGFGPLGACGVGAESRG